MANNHGDRVRPLSRVVPLPNGRTSWLINGGDPNYLLSGMILQVAVGNTVGKFHLHHNQKLTCPLKRGHFKRKGSSSNHYFSGSNVKFSRAVDRHIPKTNLIPHMDVSKNRGTPKSSHFNRVFFHYFHHPFWGTCGLPPSDKAATIHTHTHTHTRRTPHVQNAGLE